ncbi:MAG: FliO/MopB family protein [Candidatus Scalindua sp.]|jgi:flagellar biosynthetic protein FliO|nr:FliO/MopB family protein [Candidatus Scalindua sp.]MBT6228813.1 FliO/MopB family protein [Candidatus Scalindua sp.]MBT6564774.1 FliO/MopB family protein [Candidatus Scalindua sp.]
MSKKICLKPVLIISLLLICFVLTVAVSQGDLFAEEKGTGWFKDDSAKSSSFNGYEGYTRVISTLLLVVALAIGTVFMLRKKYGVKTKIGRGKKFIQIVDHASMGVKKSVFMIKVPGKHLLLGVTNDRIELITEIENRDIADGKEIVDKNDFLNLVKKSISERKQ